MVSSVPKQQVSISGGISSDKTDDLSKLLSVKPLLLKPQIDGALDDACWKNAAVASNFSSENGGMAQAQTSALLAFDKQNLYISVYCCDIHPGRSQAKDSVQIMLSPNDSGSPYYVITLPAAGSAGFKSVLGKGSSAYQPKGFVCYIANEDNYWTAEMTVPWASLDTFYPPMPVRWHLRVVRSETVDTPENSYWSQDSSGYNSDRGFGAFVLTP
jgi:hypothetical protein